MATTGERRVVEIGGEGTTIEIEQTDPALDETLCLACGRELARCLCSPGELARAAAQTELTSAGTSPGYLASLRYVLRRLMGRR